jgi:hypothetical protein
MAAIPTSVRAKLSTLKRMQACERRNEGGCMGRIEWHHALMYGGKRVQEPLGIIALCHEHHDGKLKNDAIARRIALQFASAEDLCRYQKQTWICGK